MRWVSMTKTSQPAVLTIRNARLADIPALMALTAKVYKEPVYSTGMLRGQISKFPRRGTIPMASGCTAWRSVSTPTGGA